MTDFEKQILLELEYVLRHAKIDERPNRNLKILVKQFLGLLDGGAIGFIEYGSRLETFIKIYVILINVRIVVELLPMEKNITSSGKVG